MTASQTPNAHTDGTRDADDDGLTILAPADPDPGPAKDETDRRTDHDEVIDDEQLADSNADLIIGRGLDFGAGPRRVFAGLDFRLPAQTVGVLHGPTASGRSTLLLALIGRSPKLNGRLEVAGLDAQRSARALRRISTAARIATVVDLEPKHSIRHAIADRSAVDGIATAEGRRSFDDLAELLEFDGATDELIEDLDGYRQTLLALTLAALRPSRLVVLDDLDRGIDLDDQARLYAAIDRLMDHTGTTVVVSTAESASIPDHAAVITLPPPGSTRSAQ